MDSLNSGHGWVWPRPDGTKARCGGPALCSKCREDQGRVIIIQIFSSGGTPLQYVLFKDDPRANELLRFLHHNTMRVSE